MPDGLKQRAVGVAVGVGVGPVQVQTLHLGIVPQPRRARLVDQRRGLEEPGEDAVFGVHPAGHHLVEKH
jgi:hypothetical protein